MRNTVEQILASQWLPKPEMRRALRLSAGLTLEQVAELVGVQKMAVSRWERGLRTPRGEDRVAYSRLLERLSEVMPHV